MRKKPKNYAFIDAQNLHMAIDELGWRIDYIHFRTYLREHYGIAKAYMFMGFKPSEQQLYNFLQSAGFIIVFKPTLQLPDGTVKGNVDAELVLHTMIEYPNYDKALIVTGDGDFYCLVEHLIKQDKLLHLMIPDNGKYSSLFRKFRPYLLYMNGLRGKLEYA